MATITSIIPIVNKSGNTITAGTAPLITGTFTDNAIGNVVWTAAGGDTSTITHGIIYNDNPNSSRVGDTVRFIDNNISFNTPDIKEEPPKTYLQLPIGKRLISI